MRLQKTHTHKVNHSAVDDFWRWDWVLIHPTKQRQTKKIMFKVKLHLKSAKVAEYLFFLINKLYFLRRWKEVG